VSEEENEDHDDHNNQKHLQQRDQSAEEFEFQPFIFVLCITSFDFFLTCPTLFSETTTSASHQRFSADHLEAASHHHQQRTQR